MPRERKRFIAVADDCDWRSKAHYADGHFDYIGIMAKIRIGTSRRIDDGIAAQHHQCSSSLSIISRRRASPACYEKRVKSPFQHLFFTAMLMRHIAAINAIKLLGYQTRGADELMPLLFIKRRPRRYHR